MNKKTIRIIASVLAILLLVGFVCTTTVNAAEITANQLKPNFDADDGGLVDKAGKIMGFIRNISVVGGVIILMILGLKYMMGSVEEKADYKKSLIPLVVGVLVIMSATTIMTFIMNFFK